MSVIDISGVWGLPRPSGPYPVLRRRRGPPPRPAPMLDDAELLRGWSRGDGFAFDELVRRHGPAVQSYLRRMTGDDEVAADAYADAFLRLARSPDAYKTLAGASFRAWLFTVARRCALDALRGRRRFAALRSRLFEAVLGAPPRIPAGERAVRNQQRACELRRALDELSEEQRTAVLLYHGHDVPTGEIALVLGISEQQVRDRIAYARRRLRDLIEPDGSLDGDG